MSAGRIWPAGRRLPTPGLDTIYFSIEIPNKGSFWSNKIHFSDLGLTKYLRKFEESMTFLIETCPFIYRLDDFPALSTDNYRHQKQKNLIANNKKVISER